MLIEALDPAVQADVRLGLIAPRAAVAVGQLPRGNQQDLAVLVIRRGLTVRQTELVVTELLDLSDDATRAQQIAQRLAGAAPAKDPLVRPTRAAKSEIDWIAGDPPHTAPRHRPARRAPRGRRTRQRGRGRRATREREPRRPRPRARSAPSDSQPQVKLSTPGHKLPVSPSNNLHPGELLTLPAPPLRRRRASFPIAEPEPEGRSCCSRGRIGGSRSRREGSGKERRGGSGSSPGLDQCKGAAKVLGYRHERGRSCAKSTPR